MGRKKDGNTAGFAPDKPKSELDGTVSAFEGLVDLSGLNLNEKQDETKMDKQGEKTIESKKEPVSNTNEKTTETPTESITDANGNNDKEPVVEEPQEPVQEQEKEQDEEPQDGGNNVEEEEEMKEKTEVMDGLDVLLQGEKKVPKKLTKSYFIEKEVADKIDKIGKKIPKSMGGTGAFVNELLKKALIDKGLW